MHSEGTTGPGSGDGSGTVIAGRYHLQRRLGRGGMGVVWEAFDSSLDRKVAVKGLLHPGAVSSDAQSEWVSRARREARAIARIGHRNVVAVHDVIEDGDQVWIVMELLDPRSLADLLQERQQLPVPHAARIGLQVLRGLTAAHEAGVLHRDMKPHNVLFRSDGRALLTDFGIATFEGAVQVTRTHEVIGTAQYLAPELLTRTAEQPHPASAASDLWALGVTLYEMVEGRRPFNGGSSYEIWIAVRDSPVPPMRYAGPLAALIEALLHKDPRQRPDAAEAERMLQEVTRDLVAPGPPAGRSPTEPARHEPAPVPVATAPAEPVGRPAAAPGAPAHAGVPAAPEPPGGRAGGRWKVPVAVLCTALLVGTGWYVWGRPDDSVKRDAAAADKNTPAPRFKDTHEELWFGVKADQPGLSQKTGGGYEGFEVDLAKEIGRRMGYSADPRKKEIRFYPVTSGTRAAMVTTKGRVDLVMATYSVGEERKKKDGVDFAGTYFNPLGALLVKKDNFKDINSRQDLKNDRSAEVCTAAGSMYEKWITDEGMTPEKNYPSGYEECAREVTTRGNNVYAMATDDVIVAGYASRFRNTRMVDTFDGGVEGYGVAMAPGQKGLKTEVCRALSKIMERRGGRPSTWMELYDKHLRPLMPDEYKVEEPELTQCEGL
ncbi:serine/threonine-protein kinase [Streptomyces sp. NBC_00236]|uniref:serine/threonine-protein kinase n=1 Tax=Streptomyces sp. NBC_00236 TaxID=2903639 RepID=UPI002E2A9413|nr:protein kinase [Streptomyces sp. NBC_00236]